MPRPCKEAGILKITLSETALKALLAGHATALVTLADEENRLAERFGVTRVQIRKQGSPDDSVIFSEENVFSEEVSPVVKAAGAEEGVKALSDGDDKVHHS